MDNKSNGKTGIGFTGLLQLLFIALKLVGVINWSWLWVLSPTWISLVIVVICLIIMFWVLRGDAVSDMMTFPDTWEEFEKSYGFTDNEEVYTNGARLIPSFRVKQWLDHLPSVKPETCEGCKHLGKWENEVEYGYPSPCTRCKRRVGDHYER